MQIVKRDKVLLNDKIKLNQANKLCNYKVLGSFIQGVLKYDYVSYDSFYTCYLSSYPIKIYALFCGNNLVKQSVYDYEIQTIISKIKEA